MSQNFIHCDGFNLFHRMLHMTNPALGIDSMIGMSLHLILYSMKKEFTNWKGTHCVFYLEGRSWRKDYYPRYKADRAIAYAAKTEKEKEDQEIMTEAFDDLVGYLDEKTNVTVLRNPTAEADDMIAMFIKSHPNDSHVLISSDSDFFQLLKYEHVRIYDPVKDILITRDGIYNDKGQKLAFEVGSTAKISVGKPDPNFVCDPDWFNYALFLKCVRGDKTDHIFSAYPGAREKGTKTKVGIMEAYKDRNLKGYSWNNFMLQKWVDEEKTEQRVKECYERNCKLIDLSQIPDNIQQECLQIIAEQTGRKSVPSVDIGVGFMKFCGKWNLKKIGDNSINFMPMLKSKYAEEENS